MPSDGNAPSSGTAPERLRSIAEGLGPERVAEIQRSRMLAAMIEVASEWGAPNVTVAHVVQRAGVSRRTFYELFDDCNDCFLAAFEEALGHVSDYVLPAFQLHGRWYERIRSSLVAFLSFLEDEPSMGRLLVVESLGAGPRALERRSRVLAHLVDAVDEGRGESRAGTGPLPPLTAEGLVGGVLSVVHSRLAGHTHSAGHPRGSLIELTGPLMSMVVLPYLGPAAARREADLPVLPPPGRARGAGGDPLRELDMRLTYRTVRVLLAVASHAGGSNRQVADESGITDQGQISKLLARLERLGLIENTGAGSARGAPNAWALTEKGREVEVAVAG